MNKITPSRGNHGNRDFQPVQAFVVCGGVRPALHPNCDNRRKRWVVPKRKRCGRGNTIQRPVLEISPADADFLRACLRQQ